MRRRTLLGGGLLGGINLSTLSKPAPGAAELNIAVMPHSPSERRLLEDWVSRFNTDSKLIDARCRVFDPSVYKSQIDQGLLPKRKWADIYYWFAGQRLIELIQKNLIRPLDDLWMNEGLDTFFSPAVRTAVSWQGRPYAIPLNYYSWGFFYRKSLFNRLGLSLPQTWNELSQLATKVKAQGIAPTVSGGGDTWTLAAWFDYLNLRLNGLAFHQRLTRGQVSFQDPRVRNVFTYWEKIRDDGWYLPAALELTWREALTYFLREKAAFMLMGNFFMESVPEAWRSDIGFFPFPKIADDIPRAEDAPIDVLVLSTYSEHLDSAKNFLSWSARPDVQSMLSGTSGKLPANQLSEAKVDAFSNLGASTLRDAAGFSQFFDRDAPHELANAALQAFGQFVTKKISVEQTIALINLVSAKTQLHQ